MKTNANSIILTIMGLACLAAAGCVERRVVYVPAPPVYVQAPPASATTPGPTVPPPSVAMEAPTSPPAPAVEVIPICPDPTLIWVPGYWSWNGGWVWVHGCWSPRPFHGSVWIAGHWGSFHGRYVWHGGQWR